VRANASTTRSLYSGELARLSGVSPDTLRFYERRGLLPLAQRTASGYRVFPPEALARVRLIRGALSHRFFGDRAHGDSSRTRSRCAPCRRVRELAANKLAALRRSTSRPAILAARIAQDARRMGPHTEGYPTRKTGGLLEAVVATHPKRQSRIVRLNGLAHGKSKREKRTMRKLILAIPAYLAISVCFGNCSTIFE